jgi:hypothetical protein
MNKDASTGQIRITLAWYSGAKTRHQFSEALDLISFLDFYLPEVLKGKTSLSGIRKVTMRTD